MAEIHLRLLLAWCECGDDFLEGTPEWDASLPFMQKFVTEIKAGMVAASMLRSNVG